MSETREERTEAARTRRRWLSLAEMVAVAGVLIAGLGLWTSWSDRRTDDAQKQASASAEAGERARLDLSGTVEKGGDRIVLKDERHDIADARFVFPPALGVEPQHPQGDPAIEADWIATPLLKLTDGGADERVGRLPVLATIRYWDGSTARTATAIYEVIWRTEGRFLKGRTLRLEGIKLRRRGGRPADLDRMWDRPAR